MKAKESLFERNGQRRLPRSVWTVNLPAQRLRERIQPAFTHVAAASDFGFVMHDATRIDLAASAAAYREALQLSAGQPMQALFVENFDAHIKHAEGFHRRWMGSNEAKRRWCERVAQMEIDMLCPQHGAIYRGADVHRFISWFDDLQVARHCHCRHPGCNHGPNP